MELEALRPLLIAWVQEQGRQGIPWTLNAVGERPGSAEPLDPYGIWVAEVMLQQTQLQVVLPYWQRWMEALPSLEALAKADAQQVLLLWQGLGYYSRARRLQQGIEQLLAEAPKSGQIPGRRSGMGHQPGQHTPHIAIEDGEWQIKGGGQNAASGAAPDAWQSHPALQGPGPQI